MLRCKEWCGRRPVLPLCPYASPLPLLNISRTGFLSGKRADHDCQVEKCRQGILHVVVPARRAGEVPGRKPPIGKPAGHTLPLLGGGTDGTCPGAFDEPRFAQIGESIWIKHELTLLYFLIRTPCNPEKTQQPIPAVPYMAVHHSIEGQLHWPCIWVTNPNTPLRCYSHGDSSHTLSSPKLPRVVLPFKWEQRVY